MPITGGPVTNLSGRLTPGGDVFSYEISADTYGPRDSYRVTFIADRDTDGAYELYSVPITGGRITKLNDEDLVPGRSVLRDFQISPDGKRLIYAVDQTIDNDFELRSVPMTGGASTRLTKFRLDLFDFYKISPDGRHVTFQADKREGNLTWQLFSVMLIDDDLCFPIKSKNNKFATVCL